MKYIPLILILGAATCFASPMKGFGERYYEEDTETSLPEYDTNKELVPNIIIGNNSYVMETNTLADISKYTGAIINKDEQATWICLNSKGINYWFISDNEMGQGDLTAIGIAKGDAGCVPYRDKLSVTVKDVPLFDAPVETVSSYFGVEPKKDKFMFCKDIKSSGEYIQGNCVQYYVGNKKIMGVFISQLTTN